MTSHVLDGLSPQLTMWKCKKSTNLFKKIKEFLREPKQKSWTLVLPMSMRLCRSGLQKSAPLIGAVSAYDWNEESMTGCMSAIILAIKVSVMIFCTALSWWTRVECITTTCNWKVSHLNIITALLAEIKNPRLSLPLENASH